MSDSAAWPVVYLIGELDAATFETMLSQVLAVVTAASGIVVDLSGLTFFAGSTGYSLLVTVINSGVQVHVRGATDAARRVIDLTGLTTLPGFEMLA
jgi:anti-anti-sigma factor